MVADLRSAVVAARKSLNQLRNELETFSALANGDRELEAQLAAVKQALTNPVEIDLASAQQGIVKARIIYGARIQERRETEAYNLARLADAEGLIALARFDFLEAAAVYNDAAMETNQISPVLAAKLLNKRADALYEHAFHFPGLDSYRMAAESLELALTHLDPGEHFHLWTQLKYKLADILMNLGERDSGSAGRAWLGSAMKAFGELMFTAFQHQLVDEYLAAGNGLSALYTISAQREGGETGRMLLTAAIETQRTTLNLATRLNRPRAWQEGMNSLGNALRNQGELTPGRDGVIFFREALETYRAVDLR